MSLLIEDISVPLQPDQLEALERAANGRPLATTLAAFALEGLEDHMERERQGSVEVLLHTDPIEGGVIS